MSDGWLDKAKEEAKKLAEAAKNANYGEMLDKTKVMAQQAAEEAKKAANTVGSAISKPKVESGAATASTSDTPSATVAPANDKNLELCLEQLKKVEALLQEVKTLLK